MPGISKIFQWKFYFLNYLLLTIESGPNQAYQISYIYLVKVELNGIRKLGRAAGNLMLSFYLLAVTPGKPKSNFMKELSGFE